MPHFQGSFIGLRDTFLDTSMVLCIPAMIFGVSFSISIDEENIRWTKTSFGLTMTRIIIGLGLAASIDYLFYILTFSMSDYVSMYFWGHAMPCVITTFFVFGLMPPIAELIGISRTSQLKEIDFEDYSSKP